MNVAEWLVRCLEAENVRVIFGIPGEENEDLMFALESSSIRFVPCRHEQGAAFIANLWGRLSGEPGVCLATLGPGATNLITGLADAQLDQAPVVAITGQGGLARLHHQSHQMIDVVQMFKPITKWNASIHTPEITAEVVRKAFKLATADKPGVTHIELPEDIAAIEVGDAAALLPQRTLPPQVPAVALARAVELLAAAQRPLILAGNGALAASAALSRLAERARIPVLGTFMGKGALSDRSPQSLLALGLGFRDYVMEAMDAADVVLAVGYDIGEMPPQRWNPRGDKRIVHLDTQPAEVYSEYQPAVEAIGEIAPALQALDAALASRRWDDDSWYAPVRQRILDDIAGYTLADGDAFTVPGTLNLIRRHLADDGLLISDVGSHKLWIARNFPTYVANGCIISNGLASMALALPGGIAAALLAPQRQVVAMMGDGGFLMNLQELETARRLGVTCTYVLVTDNEFGLIRWNQDRHRGHHFGTDLQNPDFGALAAAFGVRAYTPQSVAELDAQLAEAIAARELNLVVVPVDAAVNLQLNDKLKHYWKEAA